MGYLVYKWVLWVWTWSLTFAWQHFVSWVTSTSWVFVLIIKTKRQTSLKYSLVWFPRLRCRNYIICLCRSQCQGLLRTDLHECLIFLHRLKAEVPTVLLPEHFCITKLTQINIVFQKQTSKSIVPWPTAKGSFTHTHERQRWHFRRKDLSTIQCERQRQLQCWGALL